MPLFIPKDRKSLFRQFLAGMYDAVVITDHNGHIIETNPRFEEYFGYALEDVVDRQIEMIVPGLSPEVVERIRRGMAEDRHVMIDAKAKAKDGSRQACEIAISAIDLMDPGDLVFTLRNVERRQAAMNQLRAKANAFDNAHSALFTCDAKGNLLDTNAAFLNMFDLASSEEARRHSFADFMGDEPLPENFKKALAGEKSTVGLVADGDDGDQYELEIALAPNRQGRKIAGVVGSVIKV